MSALLKTIALCFGAIARLDAVEATDSSNTLDIDSKYSGRALFEQACSQCHEHGLPRAPMKSLLMRMTPNAVYNVITKGAMQVQASRLSDDERRQIVEYLTGHRPNESQNIPPWKCKKDTAWFDPNATSVGSGWGIDAENTRSLGIKQAGLEAEDLSRLKLKWAFTFPDSIEVRSQPLIVGNTLFVGSPSGSVYAMDANSGCVHWTFQAAGEIRGGLVYRRHIVGAGRTDSTPTLFFGDVFAFAYALDAATGSLRWKVKVDDHPAARIAGTPVLWQDRMYVPTGSFGEEDAAVSGDYACCTFRGSVSALDGMTGKIIWKRYTIPVPAVVQYSNSAGGKHFGPSGAGVWSSPAIDRSRGLLYFATGNNYSDPGDDNSDAIFAVDLATGKVKWKRQTLANDTYNDGCLGGRRAPTCPEKPGLDADFTAPPMLVHRKNGNDILLAGQKSGDVYGIDPDTGEISWQNRISHDTEPLSGAIWFGLVVQNGRVFVPVMSVPSYTAAPDPRDSDDGMADQRSGPFRFNGLYALSAFTGRLLWSAPVANYCEKKTRCAGISMAPMGIPGAVLAGSMDGYIRAFDSRTGKVLWRFDTARQFKSLSGEPATGGRIWGAGAIMVANGMVYVSSSRQTEGILLAFSIDRHAGSRAPRTRAHGSGY